MADISPYLAIRTFVPNPVLPGGVPIVAPIGCSRIDITNSDASNAASVFTDLQNITGTTRPLAASGTITLQAGAIAWGPGAVVCYVGAAGVGPIVCTFTR